MSYDLIEIVPLTNDYTQIPNALINADIENNVFRALCWLLSLRGGTVSSRQIARATNLGYDGRPHRQVMRQLRELGILSSVTIKTETSFGEFLKLDLNKVLSVPPSRTRSKTNVRTICTNVRAKRPNVSCETSDVLKIDCDGARPLPNSEARPIAETTKKTRKQVAQELGLPVYCQKTGRREQ